jgi:hypothetical protein
MVERLWAVNEVLGSFTELASYLIPSLEAQSQLVWTLDLSIPPKLVADCVAKRDAVVIRERSGRTSRQQSSVQSNRYI